MAVLDKRVKRTQKLLASALIDLTLQKGYEAVTIKDITDYADVGYATFFRHYHDKDDLLQDVSEVVLESFVQRLSPADVKNDPTQVGVILFRYVQENSELIRVLLGGRASRKRVIEASVQHTLQNSPADKDGMIPPEIAAFHLVNSGISLIEWWLEHNMPYPPEQMGTIYMGLIAGLSSY